MLSSSSIQYINYCFGAALVLGLIVIAFLKFVDPNRNDNSDVQVELPARKSLEQRVDEE
jgi:hypothetical protein